jgi:hypothetical protein
MANAQNNTLLQAAQSNAETKACKRVFFSPAQEEIQFISPTLRFFNFFATAHSTTVKQSDSLLQTLTGRGNKTRTTEARTGNTGFASGGVTCKLGALCYYSSSVLVDSFVLRNPPERKARNR